jgi:predicted phage tail protein
MERSDRPMATTIHLWGELGDRWGETVKIEANTFRDARMALCHVLPGFRHWVLEHPEFHYSVVVKGVNWEKELTLDEDDFPVDNLELHVVPSLIGGGKTIMGIGLILIGAFTGNVGLIISGVVSLFSPGGGGNKAKKPDPSSYFLSQGNLQTNEGNVIPIVGGVVILKNPQAISYQVRSDVQT